MYTRTFQKSFNQNAKYEAAQGRVELKVPNGRGGVVTKPIFYGTKKQCEQFKDGVNAAIRATEKFGVAKPAPKPAPKPKAKPVARPVPKPGAKPALKKRIG